MSEPPSAPTLTAEQAFQVKYFEVQVGKMTEQQAKEELKKLYAHSVYRAEEFKRQIGNQWGLTNDT